MSSFFVSFFFLNATQIKHYYHAHYKGSIIGIYKKVAFFNFEKKEPKAERSAKFSAKVYVQLVAQM